jgi:hypothetical protein
MSRTGNERKVTLSAAALAVEITVFLTLPGFLGLAAAAATPVAPEVVCRAAIGSLMHRDPKLYRVTATDSDVLLLSYVRRIDNFVWTYRCRIQGDRVIWASVPGRWRDGPNDEKISFEMTTDGKQLRIVNDRGGRSPTERLFDPDKLR